MPQPLSLGRQLLAEDFLLANETLILVKPLAPGVSTPISLTLTTSATVALNAVSIPLVLPLPDKLYAGSPLTFGSTKVILTADALAGATAIQIEAATATIAAAATSQTFALIPLYSSNDNTTQIGETLVKGRNFLSGLWESQDLAMRSFEITVSGTFVIGDPGAEAIRIAGKGKAKIYLEVHNPSNQGGEKGTGFVTKWSFKRKQDNYCEIGCTVVGDGALEDIPVT